MCNELESFTNWDKRCSRYSMSTNFNQVSGKNNNNSQVSIPNFNISSSVHATPSKKLGRDNYTTDIDKEICSICHIRYMPKEDVATDYENSKKGEK